MELARKRTEREEPAGLAMPRAASAIFLLTGIPETTILSGGTPIPESLVTISPLAAK